jgi:hypothetical protein
MAPLRQPFADPNSAQPNGELLRRLNEAIGRIRSEAGQIVGPEANAQTKRILNLLGVAVEEQIQSLQAQADASGGDETQSANMVGVTDAEAASHAATRNDSPAKSGARGSK